MNAGQAYLDESESNQSLDPDVYLLAAAVPARGCDELARRELAALRLPGQRKLHWHDESEWRRHQIIDVVCQLDIEHVVVVRAGIRGERVERRRRKCLEIMLRELEQLGVVEATFESRGTADDDRDFRLLATVRSRGWLDPRLRMVHVAGPKEPLLWIPDALCGATTQDRVGDDSYLLQLQTATRIRFLSIAS